MEKYSLPAHPSFISSERRLQLTIFRILWDEEDFSMPGFLTLPAASYSFFQTTKEILNFTDKTEVKDRCLKFAIPLCWLRSYRTLRF